MYEQLTDVQTVDEFYRARSGLHFVLNSLSRAGAESLLRTTLPVSPMIRLAARELNQKVNAIVICEFAKPEQANYARFLWRPEGVNPVVDLSDEEGRYVDPYEVDGRDNLASLETHIRLADEVIRFAKSDRSFSTPDYCAA